MFTYKFNASRGGHSPGHLREAFGELIETGSVPGEDFWYDEKPRSEDWVLGQLWNCTDIMPSPLVHDLNDLVPFGDPLILHGSTYATGVRRYKQYRNA